MSRNRKIVCSQCGMEFTDLGVSSCPKCDISLKDVFVDELYIVDVAHKGETRDIAADKIDEAVNYCIRNSLKGLKIIHGYGSVDGNSGVIKDVAYRTLKAYAGKYEGKVVKDKNNEGAHILYFDTKRPRK